MRQPKRVCRQCGEEFVLLPSKPGNINDCPSCAEETVTPLMAKVAWSGKHCVEIEITSDTRAAIAFNKAQRRNGATCLSGIVTPREDNSGREASKQGSGAEKGAQYTSKLGEKRTVK